MLYYLTVAALVVHALFWGSGLAMLLVPKRWLICWPLVALPAGIALQSAVVWVGGWLPLAGTDSYGRWALFLPLGLLIASWRLGRIRLDAAGWKSGGVVIMLALAVAMFVVSPWAKRGGRLTSITNGNCDVADYAAGARVFKEFSPQDRSGFIGQTEVVGVAHVSNFFDHWRQLNHFMPAALLALNASVFGLQVHELCGLLGVLLLAVLVPVTVLVARCVVRLPRRMALAVAVLVGIGPVQGYAVYQVALGQMLAAAAVGLLLWGGFVLLRAAQLQQRVWSILGILLLGGWILLGSYTFFMVVALAPLAGTAAWHLMRRSGMERLGRLLPVLFTALALLAAFGWERLAGFALRWQLHDSVEYGWPISALRPDGWLGIVSTAELDRVAPWWGWPLSAALIGAPIWCLKRYWNRDPLRVWTATGIAAPVLLGYAILTVKGSVPGSNASYDAYKLLACFQPVLLVSLLWWLRCLRSWLAVVMPLALIGGVMLAGVPMRARAAMRPLYVFPELAALQEVENRHDVGSVNILCTEMWPRLWANALLLRKPQYFSIPTYEGRQPTRLAGEWNLRDKLVLVQPWAESDFVQLAGGYSLTRANAPIWLHADLGAGWYPLETIGPIRWHWAGERGSIRLLNPSTKSIDVTLKLKVQGIRSGRLWMFLKGTQVADLPLTKEVVELSLDHLVLPPGGVELVLQSRETAMSPGLYDSRKISLSLHGLILSPSRPSK